MSERELSKMEAEALLAALANKITVSEGETKCALQALAPHISAAAARLADKRRERRSVRLQALALAGCSLLFLFLLWVALQYKAVLLANPIRLVIVLGVSVLAILPVICLPIFMKGRGNN